MLTCQRPVFYAQWQKDLRIKTCKMSEHLQGEKMKTTISVRRDIMHFSGNCRYGDVPQKQGTNILYVLSFLLLMQSG